jgi:hypothetical protein
MLRNRRGRALAIPVIVLAWMVAVPAVVRPVAAAGDPVIAAAGDISCDPANTHFNGGNGTGTYCMEMATSNLLVNHGYSAVLPLGDNQYYCGSLAAYEGSYNESWGRVKSITHPVPGVHEYLTHGGSEPFTGCDSSNANGAGYYSYFGAAAGTAGQGWYSYDIGAWHLIALNTQCTPAGGCGPSSPQGKWLAADLAAHQNQCTLAYWHLPLFSSGGRANTNSQKFWQMLYAAGADVALDGDDHIYERFAPQTPTGASDPQHGITQFTVGTGGANHTDVQGPIAANSVVRNNTSFGVLALTLHQASYSWQFISATGSFTDSGSASCHSASASPTPSATATSTSAPSSTPTHTAAPTATPTSAPTATPTHTAAPTATPTATSTTGTGGSATLTPVADSYVDASAPTTNHGTTTALRVDGSPVVRSYLRFNVSGLTGSATSATLRVWATSAQSTGYDAFAVADTTWGETTITDSNAPPFGAKLGSSGAVTAGTWTSVNVTTAVTGNGLISFGLSTTNSTALALSSREGANPPQLVISGPGIAPVVGPTRTPGPGQIPALAFLLMMPMLLPGLILVSRPGGRSTILAALRNGAVRTNPANTRRTRATAD